MVAIFTGSGAGLENGSGSVLGGAGLLGQSSLGRAGENLFFNAANGNLVVSQQDEFLVGRGPDIGISRIRNDRINPQLIKQGFKPQETIIISDLQTKVGK